MKNLICAIAMMLITTIAQAGDFYFFGGFFAYNDTMTAPDYKGLSPNGFYGIKYTETFDKGLSIEAGIKHESSISYREEDGGFNGVFTQLNVRLY